MARCPPMLAIFFDNVFLLLPLLGGGIVHGLVMKRNWLPWLARPIDGGRSLGGVRWFGDNKTWRGPTCLGLGAALVFALEASPAWLPFGFAYGFVAMLGELPNSFLKRRVGIAPGAGGGGRFAWFFYLYDQVDLLVAVLPFWWWLGKLSVPHVALALLLVTVIHQLVSSIAFRLGIRKTPR